MNCWSYIKCGREKDGANASKLGICPAYPEHGRDCWKIAGTFCRGKVEGIEANKKKNCLSCRWFVMVDKLKFAEEEALNDQVENKRAKI